MSDSTATLMRTDYPCQRRLWPGADARDPRNLLLAKEYRAGAVRDGDRIATVRAHRILEAGGTRGRLVLEF
jgi:hypothetical protein